jgi:hypothetical protein
MSVDQGSIKLTGADSYIQTSVPVTSGVLLVDLEVSMEADLAASSQDKCIFAVSTDGITWTTLAEVDEKKSVQDVTTDVSVASASSLFLRMTVDGSSSTSSSAKCYLDWVDVSCSDRRARFLRAGQASPTKVLWSWF